jgi:hypothetical protein
MMRKIFSLWMQFLPRKAPATQVGCKKDETETMGHRRVQVTVERETVSMWVRGPSAADADGQNRERDQEVQQDGGNTNHNSKKKETLMKKNIRIVSVVLTLALGFGLVGGPALRGQDAATASVVPRLIKFSGVMTSSGTPNRTGDGASGGPVTATFSLYELQEGGAPLWSESQKVQLDEQGRYVVLLGATDPAGLPLDLFTSGKALWLGVQPQLSAAGELPRVLLVAVPYALKASDSDTLGGKPASAYALAGAPAVVDLATTTTPGSKPAGTVQPLTACSALTSDGTAAAGEIAKFTTACNLEKSLMRDTGTGVAVGGTATPAALFDVQFTSTATSGTLLGQRVLSTLNPSAASSADVSGFYSQTQTMSGNTQNSTNLISALDTLMDHYGTGTLANVEGMNSMVANNATGTMTNAMELSRSWRTLPRERSPTDMVCM